MEQEAGIIGLGIMGGAMSANALIVNSVATWNASATR